MGKKKKTEAKISPARLGKLIADFDLVDISLTHGLFQQNLNEGDLPTKIDSTYKLEPTYDKSQKLLVVIATCSVVGAYGEIPEDTAEIPLRISAVHQIVYSSEKQVRASAVELQEYARQMSRFHVWPYWREFVQNITTRMGMPALTLPLLKTRPDIKKPPKKKRVTKKK